MANLSKDIQCADSDTRPPMLDRTDFASWQQRIRLYCRGKENWVSILKSIDKGSFQMRTIRETLAEGTKGAPHLGPERPRVYSDLSPEEKDRSMKNQSWPFIETCVSLDHNPYHLFCSNFVGLYFSWVLEVMEVEEGDYPVVFRDGENS
nr:integrase, catalytic region, zinc finger, CCHC-type, peptidase aspartic, catalytic [Tanacetum cinerariifolium]